VSDLRFGAYRTTETIGTGALSTIYRAVQEPLGRVVAVKALKTQIAATSSFGEQLEREAKVLSDLVHPNIVMLLESARTESGRPFLVLEHVEGASVLELVAKRKLAIPAALAIACGVCAGLEHVHSRGVVHRDVKPGNILVSRAGIVKLIDFGIAQRPRLGSLSDAGITEGITASGRLAPEQLKDAYGTPAYMSPEQILGDFVDGRSDLFSLGVVLYQMLSGARPFGDDPKGGGQRIRRDVAPNLREKAKGVPRAVERIVMRLLEKSPNDRYPSASAVRERLEAALRAETREDPTAIIRGALVAAGIKADDPVEATAPPSKATEAAPASVAMPKSRRPRAQRPFLGFFAVTAVFALAIYANEGTQRAREARAALAPPPPVTLEGGGGLRVMATPWAKVLVDGQNMETTPFARLLPLSPGKHWVTLLHPEAPAVEREVTIVPGETVMLDVTMDLAGDAGKDAQ